MWKYLRSTALMKKKSNKTIGVRIGLPGDTTTELL